MEHLRVVEARRLVQRLVGCRAWWEEIPAQRLATPRSFNEQNLLPWQRSVERKARAVFRTDVLPFPEIFVAAAPGEKRRDVVISAMW